MVEQARTLVDSLVPKTLTQLLANSTLDYINSFHPMLVSFGDHLCALQVKVSSLLGQQRDLGAYGMTPEMELMKIYEDLLGYFEWVDEAKRSVVKVQLARCIIQYTCFRIIDPGQ